MIKNLLISLIISTLIVSNSYAAGSSDSGSSKTKTKYDMAVTHIKAAKNFEKKDKIDKAKKRYEKAKKLLVQSNKNFPNKPDTLNYLGFTTRKLGDFENGEKFYLQGLKSDPKHIGINEYLGELYVATNRIDLAKKRLEILSSCNCEEYVELKEIIDGNKKSKY